MVENVSLNKKNVESFWVVSIPGKDSIELYLDPKR